MDKMSQEKGRQYDGKSRPVNDTYRKRWDEIFGKKEKTLQEELMEGYEKEKKNEIHIDYEYLESLKDKL
jgi:hypothetical protein